MLVVRDNAGNMPTKVHNADFHKKRDMMPKKMPASSGHPKRQLRGLRPKFGPITPGGSIGVSFERFAHSDFTRFAHVW